MDPKGGTNVSDSFFSELVAWFAENWSGSSGIPARILEHLEMSFVAVAVAAVVALPLGLAIGHTRRAEFLVVSTVNLGRAIPSFGLLFLFVILFGLGLDLPSWLRPPILFALILLAIPPILTNTYVGVQGADQDTLEAARGMGLTGGQILRGLEIPLGAPLIVAGLRIAAVQVIATASLAAVVAGGGLGRFIVDGFATGNDPQIFGGALLVAGLALATELALGFVERRVTPRTRTRERKHRRREQLPVDYRVA
ncbi:MAG TPA: ABC transporter permease [Actinomycetota bacterium]|nr:ABC transporter permease [Actinomycetota bacterium]